jgi:hypothetical protein
MQEIFKTKYGNIVKIKSMETSTGYRAILKIKVGKNPIQTYKTRPNRLHIIDAFQDARSLFADIQDKNRFLGRNFI